MSKSIVLPALPQQNKGMSLKYFVVFLVAMAVLFSLAHAGTDQTAVDDVWTELQGWAKGAPGKIIALMSFFIAPLFREKLNTQFMRGARSSYQTGQISGTGSLNGEEDMRNRNASDPSGSLALRVRED